ncbi:hypothetical protein [Lysinibacillus sp. NPDC056232]
MKATEWTGRTTDTKRLVTERSNRATESPRLWQFFCSESKASATITLRRN